MEAMLEYGSEYIPSENCHSEFELYKKLGKIENLMEKYEIEDFVELEIALDQYYHRYDKVETRRVDNIDTVEEIKELIAKANAYDTLSNELGCPLEVVFKALKEGEIFVKKGYCIGAGETYDLNKNFYIQNISYDEITEEQLEECDYYKGYENSWKFIFYEFDNYGIAEKYLVNVKDYGKTWWLIGEREESE